MKSTVLIDAETKQQVLVIFGEGGASFAKQTKDNDGTYTEIYNTEAELVVSVLQTPAEIQKLLEQQ